VGAFQKEVWKKALSKDEQGELWQARGDGSPIATHHSASGEIDPEFIYVNRMWTEHPRDSLRERETGQRLRREEERVRTTCQRRRARLLPVLGAMCALIGLNRAPSARADEPLVVLDPGHTTSHPGATSVRGTTELGYNDAMVALLRMKLAEKGFRVGVTRVPGEEIGLDARAARASARGAWLLLSIHHDSSQLRYLEQVERDGKPAYRATRPIRGYSIFVSGRNPRYENSLAVAKALGRRLLALGRPPTLHHAEQIAGERRPLVDRELGVYRFDGLRVLKRATCPAVLLEVGVLVDEADEAYVSDPVRREAIADAIALGLWDARRDGGVPSTQVSSRRQHQPENR